MRRLAKILLSTALTVGPTYASETKTPIIEPQRQENVREGLQLSTLVEETARRVYSFDALGAAGLVGFSAATFAMSDADTSIARTYQHSVRNTTTNRVGRVFEHAGDETGLLIAAGAYALGKKYAPETAFSEWATRAAAAHLTGSPGVFAGQFLLGGDRPSESDSSRWEFLSSGHGVSGHTFTSAVPFLTAASMSKSRAAKGGWYALSALGGLSRINNNAHYASQVILGYAWAWHTVRQVSAVANGERPPRIRTTPILEDGRIGVLLTIPLERE